MTIDIGGALRDAASKLATRRGAVLLLAYLGYGLADAVTRDTLGARVAEQTANATGNATGAAANATGAAANATGAAANATGTAANATGIGPLSAIGSGNALATDLPFTQAFVLFLAVFLVGEALRLIAIRSFGGGDASIGGLASDRGRTYATLVAATVVMQLLTQVGLQLFVAPALVIAVVAYFVRQEIALEGRGIVAATRESLELARTNPLEILALLSVIFLLQLAVTQAVWYLGLATVPTVALSSLVAQVISVYGIAVATVAWQDARAERDEALEAAAASADEAPADEALADAESDDAESSEGGR